MAKTAAPKIDYPTTELGMLRAAIAEATEQGDTEWAAFLTGKLANFGGASEIPAQEIKAQGNPTGDTSSRHQAKGNGLTTPKQLALIVKLTWEKTGVNLEEAGRETMLEATKNLTVQNASKTIDLLFNLPRFTQAQMAVAAKGLEPIPADAPPAGVEVAPVVEEPTVLPGRYVVKGRFIRVNQGKKGSQWFGTIFVKDTETDRNLRDAERAEVLAYIAANPAECALEYTKLTGRCTCCTRELINAESIEAAMGPICSGKFGRAYGMTILGEVYVEKPKRAKKAAAAPVVIEAEVLEGEIVEPTPALDAPVVVQAEDRFRGHAIPTPVVGVSGPAASKAQKVLDALSSAGEKGSLAVDEANGLTVLAATVRGEVLTVTWHGASFCYGAVSTLGGKKFRNVSELLRLIG